MGSGGLPAGMQLAAVRPAGSGEEDSFGLVFELVDTDLRGLERGIEPQVIATGEEPIADGAIDPAADAADDLADADGRDVE